ncbi:MAG: amidohydrolase family protein [Acidimicrobiales bacterium]|nr:amidohydrolase family protein [Acidimicrobiales bacterium]
MWSDSATAFGLDDRGRIEVGRRGDLNVLDHVHLANDLATGVVSTLLGGVEVVSFDELTGVSAGMPVSVPSSTHK